MWAKHKQNQGFTIVELLIVIVVIGVLAAVSVVAYNGVQQKAANSQTVAALEGWIKALTLYKVDNGRWPAGWVCLGEGYLYGSSGTDTTGTAQCRQTGTTGYTVTTAFDNSMKPYTGAKMPTPAFVTAQQDASNWRRGLMYAYGGGDGTIVYIEAAFAGQLSVCPEVKGIAAKSRAVWGQNSYCNYYIGTTSDT